jgi:ribosomal-protein-alanine N-acetyltransferase
MVASQIPGRAGDSAAMSFRIRPLRGRDLWKVLSIEWRAFPQDPWTTATAKGWLARSSIGGHPRYAVWLEKVIRFTRATEAVSAIRLIRLAAARRPSRLRYVVAETDSTIVGYACLNAVGGKGDVQTIAVRPDRQGQGIAGSILADLIATATACGCSEVSLYVRADNARARRLYQRTGFTETGILPGYYQPSGTDAIVMRMDIRSSPTSEPRI